VVATLVESVLDKLDSIHLRRVMKDAELGGGHGPKEGR
jgi:hypothetical protein